MTYPAEIIFIMAKGSLRRQGIGKLNVMLQNGKGTSKHYDKHNNPEVMKDKIYSTTTFRNYQSTWGYFCQFIEEKGWKIYAIEDIKHHHIQKYITDLELRRFPATTVKTYLLPVIKLTGFSQSDFKLPHRHSNDVTSSHANTLRDQKFFATERGAAIANFIKATGLRRDEAAKVRGSDLLMKDGRLYVQVIGGKGGKDRLAPISGSKEEINAVFNIMQDAGYNKVFGRMPTGDLQSFRKIYCARIYFENARKEVRLLPRAERYSSRLKKYNGRVFDKVAMRIASEALGHCRVDIIGGFYLDEIARILDEAMRDGFR